MGNLRNQINKWIIEHKDWSSFIFSIFTAAFFGFLLKDFQWWHNLIVTGISFPISFLIAQVITTTLTCGEICEKKINKFDSLVSKIDQFDLLMPKIISMLETKFMVLDSDDQSLGNRLKDLNNERNVSRWIMMRFIARKLSHDFKNLKFKINSEDYSELSKYLYAEVKKELLISNPFNPYEWFRGLIPEDQRETLYLKLIEARTIENVEKLNLKQYTPHHVKAWREIDDSKRKRVIILLESEKDIFFVYEPYYRAFQVMNEIKLNKDTIFITDKGLEDWHISDFCQEDYGKYDFAFYDYNIAIKWERPYSNHQHSEIEMLDLNDLQNQKFKALHTQITRKWDQLLPNPDLIDETIKRSKYDFIQMVKNSEPKAIRHSWCYHVHGGDCWKKINESQDYTLGTLEREYLPNFIDKSLVHITKNCLRKTFDVVHIGVGSGIEINTILEHFHTKSFEIENYVLVDISSSILRRTWEAISQIPSNERNKIDFVEQRINVLEKNIKRPKSGNPIIIILVANGYLFSNPELLKKLNSIMREGDYLFVTTEKRWEEKTNDHSGLKKSYEFKEALQLFNISLNLIGVNTTEKDYYEFGFFDDGKPWLFEGKFKNKEWNDAHPDKKSDIDSNVAPLIQIFTSFKPKNKEEVEDYLKVVSGLKLCEFFDDDTKMAGYIIDKS